MSLARADPEGIAEAQRRGDAEKERQLTLGLNLKQPRAYAAGVNTRLLLRWFPAVLLCSSLHRAAAADAPPRNNLKRPSEILLVEAKQVTPDQTASWRREGFAGVALLLEEKASDRTAAERLVHQESLELYYWIEVGRNARLAEAHPAWMASIGMHDDWRKQFPSLRKLEPGEVVKAYPWASNVS